MAVFSAALLLLSYLRSRNTIFWSDEVMGWLVLHDDTLRHVFRSWSGGADSSGFLFYVIGRPWLWLFHDREIALRLFSATGVAISAVVTWACCRRFFAYGVVAALVPLIFLDNWVMVWQLGNGRTYGLFMTGVACAAYAFALADPERPLARRVLVFTFAAHLLLVLSHVLGSLYSGVFVAGLIARDLWFRKLRWKLYLSAVLAWMGIALSWGNIVSTSALGKPSFWTLRPHLRDLELGFVDYDLTFRVTCIVLLLCVLASYMARRGAGVRASAIQKDRVSVYFLIGIFFAAVLLIFAISRVTTSIFVDRYLLPILVGDALLGCLLVTLLLDWWKAGRSTRAALGMLVVVLIGFSYYRALKMESLYPQEDYTAELLARIPTGVPAVITHQGIFVEMIHYRNKDARMIVPLDWPIALEAAPLWGGVSAEHEMVNLKKLGYYSDQIQPTEQILQENKEFLVIAATSNQVWFKRRIEPDPRFAVADFGEFEENGTYLKLWMVKRR